MKTKKRQNSDQWLDTVAQALKNMRTEKGYTSYETFAIDHGLDRKQYWRVENASNITLKTLTRILEIHGHDLISFAQELKKADPPKLKPAQAVKTKKNR